MASKRRELPPEWGLSYTRFSDRKQSKGVSRERQQEDFARFCQRHGLKPYHDSFADDGLSGYHGVHKDKGDLGRLLDILRHKPDFGPGKVLVIEAWDRLGRLRPDEMIALISEILKTGLRIGVCRLDDIFEERDFGTHKWTQLAVFVQLAYEESRQKSERIKDAWNRRYRQVREGRRDLLTAWMPAWVEAKDGKLVLIPKRAKAVATIFALARQGLGATRIAQKLREDRVPPFGPTEEWQTDYVRTILRDRRALGELQPKTGKDRQANGEKLTGYYPAVVSLDEYLDARAAIDGRKRLKAGRIGKDVANLFSGLLVNARDGQSYRVNTRMDTGKPERFLTAASFVDGKGPCYSFPFRVFERALLQGLKEIDPREILPQTPADDRVSALEIEIATVRKRLTEYNAELDEAERGSIKSIARKIGELEDREQALMVELDQASEEAIKPLADTWTDVRSLTDFLDEATPEELTDLRTRLRNAIRRIVASIHVLVVSKGRSRLCFVQIFFRATDDNPTPPHRQYLIYHRPTIANARARTEGFWQMKSYREDEFEALTQTAIDLRDPDCVQFMLANLEGMLNYSDTIWGKYVKYPLP